MDEWGLPAAATHALAALAGGSVFAMIAPDRKSWWKSAASIAVGFLASLFTSPWICEWRGWQSVHSQHAVAFGAGLVGNPLCQAVLSETMKRAAGAISERLFGRWGGDTEMPRPRRPRPDSDEVA